MIFLERVVSGGGEAGKWSRKRCEATCDWCGKRTTVRLDSALKKVERNLEIYGEENKSFYVCKGCSSRQNVVEALNARHGADNWTQRSIEEV